MSRKLAIIAGATMFATSAFAQATAPAPSNATMAPAASSATMYSKTATDGKTVTDWYKQDVYNNANEKVANVQDVLVGMDGKVSGLVLGVGGFLGVGEKNVIVPFTAVKQTTKDSKQTLMMDTNKDALKSATGFKYDRNSTTWMPADK